VFCILIVQNRFARLGKIAIGRNSTVRFEIAPKPQTCGAMVGKCIQKKVARNWQWFCRGLADFNVSEKRVQENT
jgi:hypothetical protein